MVNGVSAKSSAIIHVRATPGQRVTSKSVGNFQNVEQIDGTTKVGFQPNIGLGFKYRGIQVDYALTDLGDQSAALYSNIFSLKVDLSIFR